MDQKLKIVKDAMDEKKAVDAVVLDVKEISTVTDYFLIGSGLNQIQVRAIADNIIERMREAGCSLPTKEGYQDGRWILLDYGNLVVHVMQPAERDFYSLENLWHDAKILSI